MLGQLFAPTTTVNVSPSLIVTVSFRRTSVVFVYQLFSSLFSVSICVSVSVPLNTQARKFLLDAVGTILTDLLSASPSGIS